MNDPIVEGLWKKVVDDWDSDARHQAFLEHCLEQGLLPEAAARYRGMMGDRERGPSAEKRLKGVAILAMNQLEATRTPPHRARRNAGALVLIVLFTAGTIALLLVASR